VSQGSYAIALTIVAGCAAIAIAVLSFLGGEAKDVNMQLEKPAQART